MRGQPCGDLAPESLAGFTIQTQNHKLILGIGMGDAKDPLGLIFRFRKGGIDFTGIDGSKNKNLIAPDNGRGTAVAINRFLPLDILVFTPSSGGSGSGRGPGGTGATPVMPVGGFSLGKIGGV